jgi:tetratricopeptide (TPR) repeat protein
MINKRKISCLIIILIFLSSRLLQAQETKSSREQILQKSREHYDEGGRLYKQGDYSGADEAFKKAQRLLESLEKEQVNIEEKAKGNSPIENIENKAQETKASANLHYNQAIEYLKTRQFTQAAKEFNQVIQLNPKDKDANYNLGVLYESYLGDKKRAKFYYTRYIKLAPRAADIADVKLWLCQIERELRLEKRKGF